MQWIAYTLAAVVLFGAWAFFGKLSLRHASWAQVSLVYGAALVLMSAAVLAGPARRSFASANWWALAASAIFGALGIAAFYLALDRGKASAVVPVVSIYPLITAALAVAFLGESLSALQIVGIGLALGGVVLVGLGA